MRANDPNVPHLRHIAEALGELREQVVFVGGAVAGLLLTDPLAHAVRATRDVDAVVNASRAMFHRIEEAVAQRGFARDVNSDVICRWVHKESGVLFDLMPAAAVATSCAATISRTCSTSSMAVRNWPTKWSQPLLPCGRPWLTPSIGYG